MENVDQLQNVQTLIVKLVKLEEEKAEITNRKIDLQDEYIIKRKAIDEELYEKCEEVTAMESDILNSVGVRYKKSFAVGKACVLVQKGCHGPDKIIVTELIRDR